MRLFYFSVVAAGLAACTHPDAQRATPAGAGSLVSQPAAPSHAAAPVAPPLDSLAIMPAKPGRLRRLTTPTRRPATLADATPDEASYAYELPNPEDLEDPRLAATEADTAIGGAKVAQTFWLNPGRDTVVFGREGTAIWVPAGAFAGSTPDAPLPPGPVELQLREYYALPDILLSNLSTDSSLGLLETGGMLHLAARSAAGQPCTLRPGAELLLRMPAARPKAGMQLYAGVRTAGHRLDWQHPRPALQPTDFEPVGPELRGNETQLQQWLRRRLAFSADEAHRLRTAQTQAQRKALRQAGRFSGKRWVEYGRLEVGVNRQGTVTKAAAIGIQDPALRERLNAAARQLPPFQPAYLHGPVSRRPAAAPRSYLTINRQRRRAAPKPLPQLPVAGSWLLDVGFTRDGRVVFPWPGHGVVSMSNANMRTFETDSARQLLRRADARQLQAVSLDSLSGYLFSAASLGWANCDRAGQLASQRVYFGVETDAPRTRVNLVFRRVRTVVLSDGERPGTRLQFFHSAPVGEAATLVAIKRENGVTYLATKDVVLSERVEKGLSFQPVSVEELRRALAKIDE